MVLPGLLLSESKDHVQPALGGTWEKAVSPRETARLAVAVPGRSLEDPL